MKTLVSTFGKEDLEKVLLAMKLLPYEKLVLIGKGEMTDCDAFKRVSALEEMSGHRLTAEELDGNDFMELVDGVSEILAELLRHESIVLNVSGGDKLLGDAAILAAFRLGVEAYHCDERLTRLPVLRGATAKDRFTPTEQRFLTSVAGKWTPLDNLVESISQGKRQPVERVMRELRKMGLLITEVQGGKIRVALSGEGKEVARAIKACSQR